MPQILSEGFFTGITKDKPVAEGLRNVHAVLNEGIAGGKITADMVPSLQRLGTWLGVIDPLDPASSWRQFSNDVRNISTENFTAAEMHKRIFTESNGMVRSQAFATIMGELISSKYIAGYDSSPKVSDQLMTVLPNQTRQRQTLAGLTHFGGFYNTVLEGHPYPETDMSEKYVTTFEEKEGGIVEVTEEALLLDNTGLIYLQAQKNGQAFGDYLERKKMRWLQDLAGTGNYYVYRPAGVGEALYNTDGSNYNYIGSGNTTSSSFNAAVPLVDWTDLDTVLQYRATEVKDDRIDGTAMPIGSVNTNLTLLVPYGKYATARNIVFGDQTRTGDGASSTPAYSYSNPISGAITTVLTSVHMSDAANYYVGNFKDQFLWTEIWPIQTFVQGSASEAAFNKDVTLRVKARCWGGLSALDSRSVTLVDGA